VGKLEGKSALSRPRHRWEDQMKTNLRDVSQDTDKQWAVMNKAMKFWIP
jgi:hypothetical protein